MTPTDSPRDSARRRFLRRATALAAATLGAGGLGLRGPGAARAQPADYKALVCIFLYGGNDGLNTIVPIDDARYGAYAAVRGSLALPRQALLPIGGLDYGLHPSLAALAPLFDAGQAAPVFNVGPLRRPLTQAGLFEALAAGDATALPDNLFSHSDQQVLWETAGASSQARTGWGGRASDALGTAWPVISVGEGTPRFGLSAATTPLALPLPGAELGAYGLRAADLADPGFASRKQALDALFADSQDVLLAEAFRQQQIGAFEVASQMAALVRVQPGQAPALAPLDNAFAPLVSDGLLRTNLAAQLYQIAKMVAAGVQLGGRRQMFFAQLNGFDTHRLQVASGDPVAGEHARLLGELAEAVAAFHAAMAALGLGDAVTTFTQSDFGRTFRPNLSLGTDHAWGGHQLVVGSAVRGGRTYGTHPTLQLGGPDDVDALSAEPGGRFLPTTSVEQYAGTLLQWLGASSDQLASVMPNAATRGPRLGFV